MPTSGTGRESQRSSKSGLSGQEAYKSSERKEKAKSSQYHAAPNSAARRGSVQPNLGSVTERPALKSRTNSAPLVERWEPESDEAGDGGQYVARNQEAHARDFAPQAGAGAMSNGQDEDEVAGVVGAVRQYQPFQSPKVLEPLQEINIAVIGAEGVGKSTFVQKALDLPNLPPTQAAERKTSIGGSEYLIRLLELPIDDVDVEEDDTITWPDTIEDKMMPRVDGAVMLYDVQDRGSFDDIPEVLTAIRKASLPSMLVSCKCDTPAAKRELDPTVIEKTARRSISGIGTLQTSEGSQESHRQAMSMILHQIIFGEPDSQVRSSSASRKRAQSNAVRSVSPRPPKGHARANSEFTGSLRKEQVQARHDSSIATYSPSDRLKVPKESPEEMHRSFLFEESASEDDSTDSARSSISAEAVSPVMTEALSISVLSENGAIFDELVDRLLAQPTSKADSKFSAIFLALYRKFAAPSRLLEAIVERFEALERNSSAQMLKTVTQLRYLAIMEQWVGQYPGDFAFSRTRRRMRTFVTKIAQSKIFTIAANEMSNHLQMVQEDDDTEWAYCDKDREASENRTSTTSTSSTLIDDPSFSFVEDMSGTTFADDRSTAATVGGETMRSASAYSTTSSQIMVNAEAAQKAAQLLQPTPRHAITKVQWRALEEQPDDIIAKELTRMDWIMFSSIRPRDLVRYVSTSEKARCKNLVHVIRMVEHFNQVADWVKNYVLFRDKPKHRALMLEKFMRVARKLRELNNYNALGAIIAGISSSSLQRLAATRELIPPSVGKDWARLGILMGSTRSHAAYRMAWDNTSTERIPYLPLHLRDLASAEQGSATFLGDEKNGRVNWKKFEIIGEAVVSMQRAQGMPYKGLGGSRGEAQVKELVLDVKLEKEEDTLYERSIQLEPSPGSGGTSEKFKQFFKR